MDQSALNGVTRHLRVQMVFENTQKLTMFFHLGKDSDTKKVGLVDVQG